MDRRTKLIAIGAAAVAGLLYAMYRGVKAVSEKYMKDANAVLEWLAWRHEALAGYEPPPPDNLEPQTLAGPELPKFDALVVHGCSMVAVPLGAADLFVDVLYPAGCRTVVITGGVGRETPPLWAELADRGMAALFGSNASHAWSGAADAAGPPESVLLPSQGASKRVAKEVDLQLPPEEAREFCSEAEVFLELFAKRCQERGLRVRYGGNPMASPISQGSADEAVVYVETASTHTGTNVEYATSTLQLLGLGTDKIVVVQQPQLHRRTCLTWHKQSGHVPYGWTIRPTEASTGRSIAEMFRYALGEAQRIPAYAAADKDFCTWPNDFPHELVASLEALEPAFDAALKLEADAKAKRRAARGPGSESGVVV